jgi:hypothetical protein
MLTPVSSRMHTRNKEPNKKSYSFFLLLKGVPLMATRISKGFLLAAVVVVLGA